MKKQIALRAVIGALTGALIGQLVMVCISLCIGEGSIVVASEALLEQAGSEVMAYILQMLGCMLYGGVWAAGSLVWEKENWSLMRQSIVHCALYSLSALPVAWMMHWFEHSVVGFLCYFGGFVALYATHW
ncbi:MAG: DUF3021 domain-containing protein, partial [Aristaeellaceae bacterium]